MKINLRSGVAPQTRIQCRSYDRWSHVSYPRSTRVLTFFMRIVWDPHTFLQQAPSCHTFPVGSTLFTLQMIGTRSWDCQHAFVLFFTTRGSSSLCCRVKCILLAFWVFAALLLDVLRYIRCFESASQPSFTHQGSVNVQLCTIHRLTCITVRVQLYFVMCPATVP